MQYPSEQIPRHFNFYSEIEELETDIITKALIIGRGNKTRAAEILGLGRTTLAEMIKKYKIKVQATWSVRRDV